MKSTDSKIAVASEPLAIARPVCAAVGWLEHPELSTRKFVDCVHRLEVELTDRVADPTIDGQAVLAGHSKPSKTEFEETAAPVVDEVAAG